MRVHIYRGWTISYDPDERSWRGEWQGMTLTARTKQELFALIDQIEKGDAE